MPYTKSDYPETMKNLNNKVRIKAIDILNAMLAEGYDEENAIPISIKQAKEWMEDATEEEVNKLSDKDLEKDDEKSDAARLQDADVRVSYHKKEGKWAVKSVGSKQVDSYHDQKKEAVKRANEITENRESQLIKEKKKD